jgi:hypothetical protein
MENTLKIGTTLTGLLVGASAAVVGMMSANAIPGDGGIAGVTGADVAVCDMPSIYRWGTSNGVTGYSVGTTSVNFGDEDLDWDGSTNDHPRIPQNMFKVLDGRITQIGMSWCKDGFCALQQQGCAPGCNGGGGCPEYLTPGCADPYSDSINGNQGGLGPRSQCNAATAIYQYPPQDLDPNYNGAWGRRCAVEIIDLNPAVNQGADYYADSMYLHKQDFQAGNGLNNASYKAMNVGSLSGQGYSLSLSGSTRVGQPGIYAWANSVNGVFIRPVDIPNDGRVHVGSHAIDNGDGTWRYEYAVYNYNSDDNVGSISIPHAAGVQITDIGFHDIHHHSGEPYSTDDWDVVDDGNSITWQCEPYNASQDNENPIRWATMYSFWFTANAAPSEIIGDLGVHKTGNTLSIDVIAPGAPENPFDLNKDGCVNGGDLGSLLLFWGTPNGDFNGDGNTDGGDLGQFIANWNNDC